MQQDEQVRDLQISTQACVDLGKLLIEVLRGLRRESFRLCDADVHHLDRCLLEQNPDVAATK